MSTHPAAFQGLPSQPFRNLSRSVSLFLLSLALLSLLLLMGATVGCSTPQAKQGEPAPQEEKRKPETPPAPIGLEEARKLIQEGKGEEVAPRIVQEFPRLSSGQQKEAVELLALVPGEKGSRALGELLATPEVKKDATLQKEIVSQLLERKDPASYQALLENVKQGNGKLDPPLIRHLGEGRYPPAVPLLTEAARDPERAGEALRALALIGDEAAKESLFQAAGERKHPGRLEALRLLPELNEPERSGTLYRSLVVDETETRPAKFAAMEGLGRLEFDQNNFALLEKIHHEHPDPEMRKRALAGMAAMKGVPGETVARHDELSLARVQARYDLWFSGSSQESSSAPQEPPLPSAPVEESPARAEPEEESPAVESPAMEEPEEEHPAAETPSMEEPEEESSLPPEIVNNPYPEPAPRRQERERSPEAPVTPVPEAEPAPAPPVAQAKPAEAKPVERLPAPEKPAPAPRKEPPAPSRKRVEKPKPSPAKPRASKKRVAKKRPTKKKRSVSPARPARRAPAAKKRTRKASPAASRQARRYRDRISANFRQTLGGDQAYDLELRLHNALLSYAESDSPSSQFLLRAYKKRYGGNEASLRKRMSRGLNQPGVLGAVISGVKREYDSRPLRIYALSRLFMIPRWQAEMLLTMVPLWRL